MKTFHQSIGLTSACTQQRALREAADFGTIAATMMHDRSELAGEWARAAAAFALVITGRCEVGGFVPRPEGAPLKYNASNIPCDMDIGPCACGAWHLEVQAR